MLKQEHYDQMEKQYRDQIEQVNHYNIIYYYQFCKLGKSLNQAKQEKQSQVLILTNRLTQEKVIISHILH